MGEGSFPLLPTPWRDFEDKSKLKIERNYEILI
jgi:hypothetical protein